MVEKEIVKAQNRGMSNGHGRYGLQVPYAMCQNHALRSHSSVNQTTYEVIGAIRLKSGIQREGG